MIFDLIIFKFHLSLTSSASQNKIKQFRFQCLNKGRIKMNNTRPFAKRFVFIDPEERLYRDFGSLRIHASEAPKHERGKRNIVVDDVVERGKDDVDKRS